MGSLTNHSPNGISHNTISVALPLLGHPVPNRCCTGSQSSVVCDSSLSTVELVVGQVSPAPASVWIWECAVCKRLGPPNTSGGATSALG
eukprot:5052817-Pyramimonas_sp.AAC.1